MQDINVCGDNSILNTGFIRADNLVIKLTTRMETNEERLMCTNDAQQNLFSMIDKIVDIERVRAEIDRANSIANLNYSKAALEDREIIKQLIEKLK